MSTSNDPTLWAGLVAALSGVAATLGWAGKRQIARIDDIEDREREYVTRPELANLETTIRDGFRGVHERIDRLVDK